MTDLVFVPPSDSVLAEVAQNIEAADRVELEASAGHKDIKEVLITSRDSSFECFVVKIGDRPVAVFGIALTDPDGLFGVPWAVLSKEMRKYPKELMRTSRAIVQRWSQMFPVLENYVHADNVRAIRWLERIGFTIGKQIKVGRSSYFYQFEMTHV